MRFISILIVSFISIIMISGCKSSSESIQYQVSGKDPVILLHDLVDGGMDMEVKGTLKYDKDNKCLFLQTGESVTTPVWPEGSTPYFENNVHGVVIPGYGTFLEGDELSTGGGGIEPSELAELDIHSNCLDADRIVIITPDI